MFTTSATPASGGGRTSDPSVAPESAVSACGSRGELAVGAAPAARDDELAALAERTLLWPLLPCHPCTCCALPRRPARAPADGVCERCRELRALYGPALERVEPLTLAHRDWPLGIALRRFKDEQHAAPQASAAREFGAALSAALEARLAGACATPTVTAVPSSRPVIRAALARATAEGWWAPELALVAHAEPGTPRQRDRSGHDRLHVVGKWRVDAGAVRARDLLVLDDLHTTGGTLYSFARALRDAGARSVRAVVLARNVGEQAAWILPALHARRRAGLRWASSPSLHELCRR